MLQKISTTSNRSSHTILDGKFGAHASEILGTIQHVLAFMNYFLLENHTVMCPSWGFVRAQDTSLGLLPYRNPYGLVTVGLRGFPIIGNILDMHC